MAEPGQEHSATLALGTQLEDGFVAPLTAVRGALEILRDYPELSEAERMRFVSTALRSCSMLERSVHKLADSVYSAGRSPGNGDAAAQAEEAGVYAKRIHLSYDKSLMELDFSELEFSNSRIVADMYDAIDVAIQKSGRKWYFLINMTDCSVWPEAWVAFAHRGKKISVNHALAMARYTENKSEAASVGKHDSSMFSSRADAVAYLESLADRPS